MSAAKTIPENFVQSIPVNPVKISSSRYAVEKARRHLLEFTKFTMPEYEVNWHHELLCKYLERWAFGDIKRLMIFMPPRSGKSELVSRRLPAWMFGRNPNISIIGASYGASLASMMNRDVQRIIDDELYRKVFPNTSLWGKNVRTTAHGSYMRNSDIFEIVDHKGVYKCAGIGGAITGMGFTHGIIDDPVKDRKTAESRTFRETTWNWYTSTFYSRRINDDARILLTLTRWNQDDLAGRLIELANNDQNAEQWTIVSFPMIAEEVLAPGDPRKPGDALWPERFSLESLKATKISMGSYDWSALMQQSPTVSGGTIFNRGWWNFYHTNEEFVELHKKEKQKVVLLPEKFDEVVQSWDLNFGEGDETSYVVGQVWGSQGADRFLLDMYRGQIDFPRTLVEFRKMSATWPQAHRKLVENKANGRAMIDSLKHEISGIVAVNPQGSKEIRARAAAPSAESGNIYLPHSTIASWIHVFIDELAEFPTGKHNDIVDSFTQYVNATRRTPIKLPRIPQKPIRVAGGWV
jgi:predicted phage terminase large subunit-like protein